MDHIQDVYKKKPDMINKIWDHLTKVNLKVDGKPFQVVYNEDEDELEYHGRSGNETKVGPLIDDMQRLFSKPINDAIRHIEKRVDVFKRYKFLTFEVISEILLLTAIIDKDGNFINNPDEIDKIAKELDTDVMPCLWKGKLTDEQKDTIMNVISSDIIPTKADFVTWVKKLFETYEKFPKSLISRSSDSIEGVVFFYEIDGKVVEYKLVDPSYAQSVKDNQLKNKQDAIKNAETSTEIYTTFVTWGEENGKALDKNRMRSIEFNFIEMMKDPKIYNKLMKDGAGLTTKTTDAYFLQLDRVSDELRKAIRKHGKVYQLLYEKYVKLFYKAKKRAFVISEDFQARVNKLVEKFADYTLDEDMIEINDKIIIESGESDPYNIAHETREEAFDYFIKNVNNKIDKNLLNKLFDLVYNLNLTQFPFRFSSHNVKLARIFINFNDSEKFLKDLSELIGNEVTKQSMSFIIDNTKIIFGNGSVDRISTANQEQGTCDVFNKYVAIKDTEASLDDIVNSLTYIEKGKEKTFSNDWKNSFYNQIKCIENIINEYKLEISDYTAVRRGNNNIGKAYYNFNIKYTKFISENEGQVDNYDPTDIIIYKTNEEKNIISKLEEYTNKLNEDIDNCINIKNQYANELFDKKILLGISLKKIAGKRNESGKIDKMNFEVTDKTKVDSFEIDNKTSDKQIKINCKGTFVLNHITSVDNGNPEGKDSFMQLTLRSFNTKGEKNQVALDIQHNGKEPSLGKCPKRYWVKLIFSKETKTTDPITFNLIECVKAFRQYLENNESDQNKLCKDFTSLIEMSMKLGASCFPYILVH